MSAHVLLPLVVVVLLVAGCASDHNPTSAEPVEEYTGITQTDADGTVIEEDPDDWCLGSGYEGWNFGMAVPNPTDGSTRVDYGLAEQCDVKIEVMRSPGQTVTVLVDQTMTEGIHSLVWDLRDSGGTRVTPGIYRCVIHAADFACYGDIEVLPLPLSD
jgi:hypothetical protein